MPFRGHKFNKNQRVKLRPEHVVPVVVTEDGQGHGQEYRLADEEDEEDATEQEIRRTQHPLAHCVICTASLDSDDKMQIMRMASDLGATFSGDFTIRVTHLVTETTASEKYKVATSIQHVKIMAPTWIKAAHEMWKSGRDSRNGYVALESEHRLPVFVGCRISTTGFDAVRVMEVKGSIEAEGGEFVPSLDPTCTHLLVEKRETPKYEAVLAWAKAADQGASLPILVWTEWLIHSLERGASQDVNHYNARASRPLHPKPWRIGESTKREEDSPETKTQVKGDEDDPEERVQLKRRPQRLAESRTASAIGLDISMQVPPLAGAKALSDDREAKLNEIAKRRQEAMAGSGGSADTTPRGKLFQVRDFDSHLVAQLEAAIEEMGGIVVERTEKCNFVVVPVTSDPDSFRDLPESAVLVTQHFISRAIATSNVVLSQDHVLSKPLGCRNVDLSNILSDLTMSHTGFSREIDRHQIRRLCALLGAECTDTLEAKNTHLVCSKRVNSSTPKLEAALDSDRIVVSETWLEACAREKKRVPIERHTMTKLSLEITQRLTDITNQDHNIEVVELGRMDSTASKIAQWRAERAEREKDRGPRSKLVRASSPSSLAISVSSRSAFESRSFVSSISFDSHSGFGQLTTGKEDESDISNTSEKPVRVQYGDLPSVMRAQENLKKGIIPSAELLEEIALERSNKRPFSDESLEQAQSKNDYPARRRSSRRPEQ